MTLDCEPSLYQPGSTAGGFSATSSWPALEKSIVESCDGRVLSRLETLLQVIEAVGHIKESGASIVSDTCEKSCTESLPYRNHIRINDLLDDRDDEEQPASSESWSRTSVGSSSPSPSLIHCPTEHSCHTLPTLAISPRSTLPSYRESFPGAQLVTITGYHGKVAQKSYGKEKRYLSPPPQIRIQCRQMDTLSARLHVITESGEKIVSQMLQPADENVIVLRQLAIPGRADIKSFKLLVEVKDKLSGATFNVSSNSLSMISKPSRKTVKARCSDHSLRENEQIALFSRINAQTVRTRYISHHPSGHFLTHCNSWSPLVLRVMEKAERLSSRIVLYNSVVVLEDVESGSQSPWLRVCKVEKNRLVRDISSPVSQMHKIALECIKTGLFWSAKAGFAPLSYVETVGGDCDDEMKLDFLPADADGLLTDHMCWTVAGTDSFQCRLEQ